MYTLCCDVPKSFHDNQDSQETCRAVMSGKLEYGTVANIAKVQLSEREYEILQSQNVISS